MGKNSNKPHYYYNNMNNEFYCYDEVKEKFPFKLPFLDECLISKNKNLFSHYLNYNDSNKVAIDNSGKSFVNKDLIIDLITDDNMYSYFSSMCNQDSNVACNIIYIENNHEEHIILTKNQFAYALDLLHDELLNVNDEYNSRFAISRYMLSINFCYDYYEKVMPNYNCIIDTKNKRIPIKELIDILTYPEDQFLEFINRRTIFRLTIEETLYMLVDFVEKHNILTKFDFTDEMINRYNKIKNYEFIDFEAVNMFSSNFTGEKKKPNNIFNINNRVKGRYVDGDSLSGKYAISPSLRDSIYKDMDPTYDPLEQAIYIYIKLCDLLSYDETEAFSFNEYIKENIDYNKINKINAYRNKVVSSEFILIYAQLLKEIGIKYRPFIDCTIGYENKYAYLSFKSSEYIIKVDLFNKSIIKNDLSKVKIGEPIDGIKCLNTNKTTRMKFKEKKNDIYSLYKKENNKDVYNKEVKVTKNNVNDKRNIDLVLSFNRVLGEFDLNGLSTINYRLYVMNNNLTLDMKVLVALSYIKDVPLNGVEYINYIQTVMDSILEPNEKVTYMLYKHIDNDIPLETYGIVLSTGNYNYLITTYNRIVNILTNSELERKSKFEGVELKEYELLNKKR